MAFLAALPWVFATTVAVGAGAIGGGLGAKRDNSLNELRALFILEETCGSMPGTLDNLRIADISATGDAVFLNGQGSEMNGTVVEHKV